ncbi:metallophosphoesterase family protein [Parafrankia sp. FMc2]|uniref:metallophosphoesterase family protein n=1 Tax=Parafrankia sp. FMc2 TaxID=3233196 RepID=UPI003B587D53
MRVAAVGDLHVVPGSAHRLRPVYQRAALVADLLLLAGDLTNRGDPESAAELCAVVGNLDLPVVAVLGNHDHDTGVGDQVAAMLGAVGAIVLDGTATTVETPGGQVGVAGVKGFAQGHAASVPPGADAAYQLRDALARLDTDLRIALTHYAPVADTLTGEDPAIHRYLGSSLLGAAIDGALAGDAPADSPTGADQPGSHESAGSQGSASSWWAYAGTGAATARTDGGRRAGNAATLPRLGVWPEPHPAAGRRRATATAAARPAREPATALAVHGHAHHGQEMGRTPGGTPVRNVARPVIVAPFAVYRLPGAARIG